MAASGHPCGALRPGQNAPGRQVGRPLSPARVRAMPERFVVIERPQKPSIRKKAGRHRAENERQGYQEGRGEVFRGKARGGAGRAGSAVLSRGIYLAFRKCKAFPMVRPAFVRRTTPPRPSPARGASRPLSSGVQAAGRFASFDCPPDWRLWPFQWHQGYGFAHVLTRSVLRAAPLRSACGFRACP